MMRYNEVSSNRKIIDTDHSVDRYISRYSSIKRDRIDKAIKDTANEILHTYHDDTGQYGFHSKSTGIGGIITWRREGDPRKDDGNNHAIVTTLFPPKKQHFFRNVKAEIIVEKQIIAWAKTKGKRRIFFKEGVGEIYSEFKTNYGDDFYATFFEGKLYDLHLKACILVD